MRFFAPEFRDLRLYLATRFLWAGAVQFQVVGVSWQIYEITNDPLWLGYVGLLEFLPMLLLALPAGDVADRVDRRLIMIATFLLQAAASALLLVITVNGSREVWQLFVIVVLFGVARGLSTPAMQTALPFLVPLERMPQAVAWSSSTYTTANVLGPALGGILLYVSPVVNYGACLVVFLIATALTATMRLRRRDDIDQRRGATLERIIEGIVYTWRHPLIFGAISLDLFAVLLGGAVALLPVYARDILFVGPWGFGFLKAAPGVGAVAVALALAYRPLARHTGKTMFQAVALFGVATIAFGLSRNFYVSLVALAVAGGADVVSVYVRSTMMQLATPDHIRGRVGSVNSLFVSASNELGQARSGFTAAWFGTVASVIIGGLGTLAVVGLWMWLFPALRRVDRFSDVVPAAHATT